MTAPLDSSQESQGTPGFMNNAIKNGLILGGISIGLTLLLYVVNYAILVQLKMLAFSLLISVGYAIYAGISYRNTIGGYLSFGKAWQHGFIMFAVSGIVSLLFTFLLYFVIDPELPQKLAEASLANSEEMMRSFGMPEDQMEEALEKARESTQNQFAPGKMALSYVFVLIGGAIFALISGAIVKKNRPVEF
ncbi:MAG: DUF4199 domain-containing protein [Cyclobacteriaceae bacterium]|nr:DUF4199 domain-containing protein [Cyclobacteriaceae bacterium]